MEKCYSFFSVTQSHYSVFIILIVIRLQHHYMCLENIFIKQTYKNGLNIREKMSHVHGDECLFDILTFANHIIYSIKCN